MILNLSKFTKNIVNKIKKKNSFDGHFERFYFAFDKDNVYNSNWLAHFFIYKKFLSLSKELPTLDLCCGSGAGTKIISSFLNTITIGIDYSKEAIDYAKINNTSKLISYHILDLNNENDIMKLSTIIKLNKIKQVFFIEGIEHVLHPEIILETLLNNGVIKIFISTPLENENVLPEKFHVHPFTPSIYEQFAKKFEFRTICYCKFVDKLIVKSQLESGLSEEKVIEQYFTKSKSEALNYLIEINREK